LAEPLQSIIRDRATRSIGFASNNEAQSSISEPAIDLAEISMSSFREFLPSLDEANQQAFRPVGGAAGASEMPQTRCAQKLISRAGSM
jgi:hypothetical protein